MDSISLSELVERIKQTIKHEFSTPFWLRAEIGEMRVNNGHCYLELIEKEKEGDHVAARIRASIWASTFRMLRPYFESETGETLRVGLNILVSVVVDFNGVYGLSVNIRDIDPVFTVGELAVRRKQIIRQLQQEGIADMNKAIAFPHLPQRLAVVSSATAAGYGDFCDQLRTNSFGFVFYTKLFPAIMQGVQAESSIIEALERIYEHIDLFDVVVIIRGGGATSDLSCFDSYELALNCAQFPLPIVAGIGHQRDVSILDMVVHTSTKTPTAAAELLIARMNAAEDNLNVLAEELTDTVAGILATERKQLDRVEMEIRQAVKSGFVRTQNLVNNSVFRLKHLLRNRMVHEKNRLSLMQSQVDIHSPKFLFERGYTITTLNGKRLTSKTEVAPDDCIVTHFSDGYIKSNVLKKNENG